VYIDNIISADAECVVYYTLKFNEAAGTEDWEIAIYGEHFVSRMLNTGWCTVNLVPPFANCCHMPKLNTFLH